MRRQINIYFQEMLVEHRKTEKKKECKFVHLLLTHFVVCVQAVQKYYHQTNVRIIFFFFTKKICCHETKGKCHRALKTLVWSWKIIYLISVRLRQARWSVTKSERLKNLTTNRINNSEFVVEPTHNKMPSLILNIYIRNKCNRNCEDIPKIHIVSAISIQTMDDTWFDAGFFRLKCGLIPWIYNRS